MLLITLSLLFFKNKIFTDFFDMEGIILGVSWTVQISKQKIQLKKEKQSNQIKLTHYDETMKRAHDSQVVRAKETLKLSHGWP